MKKSLIQKEIEMKSLRLELEGISSVLSALRRETNTVNVPGEGSLDARLMFIGEAPGKKESLTGRPFCGASGKVLTILIESLGLKREEVYITSIVTDRPPENRDPTPEEIAIYAPYMDRQISIIKPKVIVTLGRISLGYLLKKYSTEDFSKKTITDLHGVIIKCKDFSIMPLYHPAVALYRRSMLPILEADILQLKKMI